MKKKSLNFCVRGSPGLEAGGVQAAVLPSIDSRLLMPSQQHRLFSEPACEEDEINVPIILSVFRDKGGLKKNKKLS